MLVKLGVDISRLKRPMRRALNNIDTVFRACGGDEAVITSTYEGTHSPSSLHYADLAVDFRLPDNLSLVVVKLKELLGKDYDVVPEHTHIHVEYDPESS